MNKFIPFFAAAFLMTTAVGAQADTFLITVNTSSIDGVGDGVVDFVLNPGPGSTQLVDAEVFNFATDGTFSMPVNQADFGSVSGGPVTTAPELLTSADGDNEDQESIFTFGDTLSFDVNLSGPAVTSPDGTATSPTTFYLQLFDEATGNPYTSLTSDPSGTVAAITINDDGSFAATPISGVSTVAEVTPEPATFSMLGGAIWLLFGIHKLTRRRQLKTPAASL